MKRTTNYLVAACAMFSLSLGAQTQLEVSEKAPNAGAGAVQSAAGVSAVWDIQKNINITAASGGNAGMAGVAFINNQFWVSEWASDTILRFDASGAMIDKFTIPGLGAVRSFSTDGITLYAGNNSGRIYRIDPTTKQLKSPGYITVSTSVQARFCAYDPNLDGGKGGFWIGTFGSDVVSVDMNGTVISSIRTSTLNMTGLYGAAVDYHTAGGSYLWVFNQGGLNNTDIVRLKLPDGSGTNMTHDVYPDISSAHSLTSGLAGGLFICDDIVTGKASLVALVQGSPNNVIVAYEIGASTVGLEEANDVEVRVYPNPAKDFVMVNLSTDTKNASYRLMDISGKPVQTGELQGGENKVALTNVAAGTYVLQVMQDGQKIGEQKIFRTE